MYVLDWVFRAWIVYMYMLDFAPTSFKFLCVPVNQVARLPLVEVPDRLIYCVFRVCVVLIVNQRQRKLTPTVKQFLANNLILLLK